MYITIINQHSSSNLGDAAITLETLNQLKMNFPQAHFTLAFNNPESHPATPEVDVVGTFRTWVLTIDNERRENWHIWQFPFQLLIALVALITYRWLGKPIYLTRNQAKRRLMEAYFKADLVVGCGGQVISTKRWLAVSFYWVIFSTLYACWSGKPVYMLPQSIGPVVASHHKLLINYLLRRVRLIMSRDDSFQSVLAPDLLERTVVLPDIAFGLTPQTPAKGWALLKQFGLEPDPTIPTIGLTVLNWSGQNISFSKAQQNQYDNAIIKLLRHIVYNLNGRVFVFAQVIGPSIREDDRFAAHHLIEQANLPPDRVIHLDKLTDVEELLTAYTTIDLIVGTRMHSTIMSLVSTTPACAISYSNKAKGMFELIGLPNSICDINDVNAEKLITLFNHSWQNRQQTKAYLEKTIPKLAQKARQASQLIRKDWYKLKLATPAKTRVLLIISSFAIEGPQGGVERFVIELASHINLTNIDLTVCGLWYHGFDYESKWMSLLSQRGIKVITTANWTGSDTQDAWNSLQFLRRYMAEQPDFDIVNSHAAFPDVIALSIYAQGKAKYLLRTVHNEREWTRRPKSQFLLNQLLAPFFFKKELGVSKKIVNNLNNRFVIRLTSKRAEVVYNSINLNRLKNINLDRIEKKQALNLPINVPIIGTVGRLVEQKGHIYFLSMAQKILATHPNCHFIIVGIGELLPQLKAQAIELGITSQVHFLGARTDVEEILAIIDIFVSTSLWEGLATVILEAMASKIPVVATEVSGSIELIEHEKTGLLVPSKNSAALSKAVCTLLNTPTLSAQYAENGYQLVQNFDIQQVALKYESLFKSANLY